MEEVFGVKNNGKRHTVHAPKGGCDSGRSGKGGNNHSEGSAALKITLTQNMSFW